MKFHMFTLRYWCVVLLVATLVLSPATSIAAERVPARVVNPTDRTVLPIQVPKRPVFKELDVRNVKLPSPFEIKAPTGAPNVVIVLIDDLGFGATSTFGGPGRGGMGTLFVNNEKVGARRIEHTQAGIFSADETADVGIDRGTPVVEAIGSEAKSRFTGRIPEVTVEVK